MCHRPRSGTAARGVSRSAALCHWRFNITSNSMVFTPTRGPIPAPGTLGRAQPQAGCMVRTEKRHGTPHLPQQIEWAVSAAEDKKANDIVVLDLRKAAGFTDYFVFCSGQNPRQIRAIADAVTDTLASHAA